MMGMQLKDDKDRRKSRIKSRIEKPDKKEEVGR